MSISLRAIILSALAAVLVLAVVLGLWLTGGDRQPATTTTSAGPTAAAPSYETSTAPADGSADPQDTDLAPAGEPGPSATPSADPSAGFAAGSDHAQAPTVEDWRPTAEAFAAAWADPHGGDHAAWLEGMEPYATDRMLEQFEYTHITNVVDDELELVESVLIEPTTMTFKAHYVETGAPYEALMVLEPSGQWKVDALGAPGAHEE